MRIGILSDTHGKLPADVFDCFKDVQHIFHAGDVGNPDILTELKSICDVTAVYGNIDTWPIVGSCPRYDLKELNNKSIFIIHDIGSRKLIRYQLFRLNLNPDIVIFGHTHRTEYFMQQNQHYINPGSVSLPKDQESGTVCILDLDEKELKPAFVKIGK